MAFTSSVPFYGRGEQAKILGWSAAFAVALVSGGRYVSNAGLSSCGYIQTTAFSIVAKEVSLLAAPYLEINAANALGLAVAFGASCGLYAAGFVAVPITLEVIGVIGTVSLALAILFPPKTHDFTFRDGTTFRGTHQEALDKLREKGETLLRDEPPSMAKSGALGFLIYGRVNVMRGTIVGLLQIAKKYNLPLLGKECEKAINPLLAEHPLDLETLRLAKEIHQEGTDEIKQVVNQWLEARSSFLNSYVEANFTNGSSFEEVRKLAKDLSSAPLKKVCEECFIKAHAALLKREPAPGTNDVYHRSLPVMDAQHTALTRPPEALEGILQQALEFGLDEAAKKIYTFLINQSASLYCMDHFAFVDRVKAAGEMQKKYVETVEKYAAHMYEAYPEVHEFQVVGLLFAGRLYSKEEAQELFRYIFSQYIIYQLCDKEHRLRHVNGNLPSLSQEHCDLTGLKMAGLYQKAARLVDQLAFPPMQEYFNEVVFYSLPVFNRALQELTFPQTKKGEHLDSIRRALYPLLARSVATHAAEVVKFEEKAFSQVPRDCVFNVQKGSDITLTLPRGTPLFLHKRVLKASPYFIGMFRGFRQATQPEIAIREERSDIFTSLMKYLYNNTLEITPQNALGVIHLAEEYSIEPFFPLRARVYLWLDSTLTELCKKFEEGDAIPFSVWDELMEVALAFDDKKIIEKILSYVFLSINYNLYILKYHKPQSQRLLYGWKPVATLTENEEKERKKFLEKNGRLLTAYTGIIHPDMIPFLSVHMPAIQKLVWKNHYFEEINLDAHLDSLKNLHHLESLELPESRCSLSFAAFQSFFDSPQVKRFQLKEFLCESNFPQMLQTVYPRMKYIYPGLNDTREFKTTDGIQAKGNLFVCK